MSNQFVPNFLSISSESPQIETTNWSIDRTPPVGTFPPGSRYSEVSIERGIGGQASHSFLLRSLGNEDHRRQQLHEQPEEEIVPPPPGVYSCLQKYEVPMEIRRRIAGCGINHYDLFDEPVGCQKSPIPRLPVFNLASPERLFDQFENDPFAKAAFVQNHFQRKTYGRPIKKPSVPKFRPPTNAIQRDLLQIRDPRYRAAVGNLSPLTDSPVSLPSPQSLSQFQPFDASEFEHTPPPSIRRSQQNRLGGHPRLIYTNSPAESESGNQSVPSTPISTPPSISGRHCETDEEVYLPESPIPRRADTLP